jgi:hypothetical protein
VAIAFRRGVFEPGIVPEPALGRCPIWVPLHESHDGLDPF